MAKKRQYHIMDFFAVLIITLMFYLLSYAMPTYSSNFTAMITMIGFVFSAVLIRMAKRVNL